MELRSLTELLSYHEQGHSRFQIQHFILTKGQMTPYGAFKQCIRELYVRVSGLLTLIYDFEIEVGTIVNYDDTQLNDIAREASRKKRALELATMQRAIEERFQEMSMFWAYATGLSNVVLPLIEESGVDSLDEAEWSYRLIRDLAISPRDGTAHEHSSFVSEERFGELKDRAAGDPDAYDWVVNARKEISQILEDARETYFPLRPSVEEIKEKVLECQTLFLTSSPQS